MEYLVMVLDCYCPWRKVCTSGAKPDRSCTLYPRFSLWTHCGGRDEQEIDWEHISMACHLVTHTSETGTKQRMTFQQTKKLTKSNYLPSVGSTASALCFIHWCLLQSHNPYIECTVHWYHMLSWCTHKKVKMSQSIVILISIEITT